ncbi:MAG: hypothetical protein IPO27_01410 [Bacteroidetes bacterium]|nr:hypothetical protein [Bacteroidota bacterium]
MKTKHSFINRIIYLIGICIFFLCNDALPQSQWAWIGGDKFLPSPVYGIMGVPSISNKPQAVYEGARWTDKDGNFWIFGQDVDDMWRYNPYTQEWTWWTWMAGSSLGNATASYGIKGVASPTNAPAGRAVYTPFKDVNGNFFVFGGFNNVAYSPLNDVWKYDPTTNLWTWVSGVAGPNQTSNFTTTCSPDTIQYPWGRIENRATWAFGNHFINFGGMDIQHGFFSDVWSFDATCRGGGCQRRHACCWHQAYRRR